MTWRRDNIIIYHTVTKTFTFFLHIIYLPCVYVCAYKRTWLKIFLACKRDKKKKETSYSFMLKIIGYWTQICVYTFNQRTWMKIFLSKDCNYFPYWFVWFFFYLSSCKNISYLSMDIIILFQPHKNPRRQMTIEWLIPKNQQVSN